MTHNNSMAYEMGWQAYQDGLSYTACPFSSIAIQALEWQRGFNDADDFLGEEDFNCSVSSSYYEDEYYLDDEN